MEHLFRSLMFIPAHNEHLMDNAAVKFKPDVYLFDLEDSVPPADKQKARENIKRYISEGKFAGKALYPRVNDRESGELLRDLYQLTIPGIEGFMYPKSTKGEDVYFVGKLLETIECEKHIPIGTYKLIPLIETAGSIVNIKDICSACTRVVAVAFGCEDYVTDIQGQRDIEGESIFTARSMVSIAARSTGIYPIDTIHTRVHDLDDLEKNLKLSKKLGFEGMLVLNPSELPLVHQYYSLSEEEIKWAKEVVAFSEASSSQGKGVALDGGRFVGPPKVKQAKKLLEKARIQSLIEGK